MSDDLHERKRHFAELLLRNPHRAQQHAFVVFPEADRLDDAIEAADTWANDPEVLAEIEAIKRGPDAERIMTLSKLEASRFLLDRAMDPHIPWKEFTPLMRLYGEYMEQIGKRNDKTNEGVSVELTEALARIAKRGKKGDA